MKKVRIIIASLLLAPVAGYCADLLSVPPALESRLWFGHSFERGIDQPERNPEAAKLAPTGGTLVANGFLGKGLKVSDLHDRAAKPLTVSADFLSPDKPLTIMLWWRLDEELPVDGGFGVLNLCHPQGGWISCFVRGKGEWCALPCPTWVYQLYKFPGLGNDHNVWTGRVVAKAGEWHHTALTIANAKEISWYRDGALANRFLVKGRNLTRGETSLVTFGDSGHPMTIDEVLIFDRVLSEQEIADYVKTAKALSAVRAVQQQTEGKRKGTDAGGRDVLTEKSEPGRLLIRMGKEADRWKLVHGYVIRGVVASTPSGNGDD